jgi:Protein of unknown function (DUF4239)
MGAWFAELSVPSMAAVVLLAVYSVAAAIYWAVTRLAVGERARAFKGFSPGLLSPLGILFGLLVGFLAAQVWGDADRAQTAVNREASALRAVVLLSASFPGPPGAGLRSLVERQVEDAAKREWPDMARHRATLTMIPVPLAEALQLAISLTPQTPGQIAAQREIVLALETALDARRQRIIISYSAINWVKWTGLLLEGVLALIATALVHSDNRVASALALGVFSTAMAVAIVLLAAHNRPFTGAIAVRPDLLLQVVPEAHGAAVPP